MTLLKPAKPNLLATDGTAAITSCKFSRCGKYFAYSISYSVCPVMSFLRVSVWLTQLREMTM